MKKRIKSESGIKFVYISKPKIVITMQVLLTSEQKVKVTLTPKTTSGRDAQVEDVRWEVLEGESTVADISEDGLSAYIVSGDNVGFSQIKVTADADLTDEGIKEIQLLFDVEVTSPLAENLGATIGTPEQK